MQFNLELSQDEAGLQLLQLLCRRYPQIEKSQWVAEFKRGQIRRGDQRMYPHFRLPVGAQIQFELPLNTSTVKSVPQVEIPVLYTDELSLVVAKPAGITVHPTDQTQAGQTLLELLQTKYPSLDLHLVHRLDHGTSGVLVLATSSQSAQDWQKRMALPSTHKIYQAWVWGRPPQDSGSITVPLTELKGGKVHVDPQGKGAITHYRVLETVGGWSLLELRLETGRTHQIRAHLGTLGCPIVGDVLYGSRVQQERQIQAKRIYLHAFELVGADFVFQAPLPGAFAGLRQRLCAVAQGGE